MLLVQQLPKPKAKGEQKVVKMALDTSLVPWHKSQDARGIPALEQRYPLFGGHIRYESYLIRRLTLQA
jgi:hypothetical protein